MKRLIVVIVLLAGSVALGLYEFTGPLVNLGDDWVASRLLYCSDACEVNSVTDFTDWVAGTAHQIYTTDDGDGSLTLNLPQDINTVSHVVFAGLDVGDVNITTGYHLTFGTTQWDDGSDDIDGEQIADDTIDDDSIDFDDVTGADLTLTDCTDITLSGDLTVDDVQWNVTGSNTIDGEQVGDDTIDDDSIDWSDVNQADIEAQDGTNILLESEIDASSELRAILDDETGTGVSVFGTSPTFTTSVIMSDRAWLGIDDSNSWAFDDVNAVISTSANVGIGETSPDATLDVEGSFRAGDDANYVQIADATGQLTLVADARVLKEFELNAVSLAPGSTGPDATVLGNYLGYSYDIGDDSVTSFELPTDWDVSEDLEVFIYWYANEAYALQNGEVQWRIQWSACPTDATEATDAPTHTGTIDFGDQNIPATAKYLTRSNTGTIAAVSLSEGDLLGFTIDRVAIDDGNDVTADPVIVRIEVEYISDSLGEAI